MPGRPRAAHAKINLTLSVGPPLAADHAKAGYHPIASWMACIDLADSVFVDEVSPGEERVIIEWAPDAPRPTPIDWPVERDLAVRAIRLLEERSQRSLPCVLQVTKRIPVGGGLGGGSSDAAAALAAANQAFALGLTTQELRAIGIKLGSDVPFFLDDRQPAGAALVTWMGDWIERMPPVSADVLLFMPPFEISTREVYRAYDELGGAALREQDVRALAVGGDPGAAALFNDLAAAADRVQPRLGEWRREIAAALGREVHVTGSGACIFAMGADCPPHVTDLCRERDVVMLRTRLV